MTIDNTIEIIARRRQPSTGWPRISVVTPSYNQADFLEDTIRSVLSQGYPDLEYIILDGGSTDGSAEIIERYADSLTYWHSRPDDGQADAINTGFSMATGDILAFLNSDDMFEPGILFEIASLFSEERPWIAGAVTACSASSGKIPVPELPGKSWTRWYMSCPISQPGVFLSAQLYGRVGQFRTDLEAGFDYEYWLRVRHLTGLEPFRVDTPAAVYRLHPGSKSVSQSDAFSSDYKRILGEYEQYLNSAERIRLALARRRRSGYETGREAFESLRGGDTRTGLVGVAHALIRWPFLPFDARTYSSVKDALRKRPGQHVFPDLWPL
jgi:glycosyltransferase involved in cell wall biosynthesis